MEQIEFKFFWPHSEHMPFDIQTPYRMRPNMRPLEENEPVTYRDHSYDQYIEQKKAIMSQAYGNNWNPHIRERVLMELQCETIEEAIETYQEDFVVWAPDTKGRLTMQMASVCFPSGWDPVLKINKTFAEIHEPVADNELIMNAADRIATMITQKGPFIRSVWTIANSNELNRHPKVKQPWTNESIEEMYYRCERQVTVPLGRAAIFFIRTYVVPLLTVDAKAIQESINTMTDEILTYKDLHYVKEKLNA